MVSEGPDNDKRRPEPPSALVADTEDMFDEEHVCMQATIPQHIDDHFSKIQDMAGTGESDALGG